MPPIVDDKYVAPTWHDDTDPPINDDELQDICDSIEKLPVANGGTGATTAKQARTNLGIVGTGNASTPIYLDSNGAPQAMSGVLPISLGGTGMGATTRIYGDADHALLLVQWGNVVMLRYRASDTLTTHREINMASSPYNIPSTCYPRTAFFLAAPGASQSGDVDAVPKVFYNVTITPGGKIDITAPSGNTTAAYPRFTATWLIW